MSSQSIEATGWDEDKVDDVTSKVLDKNLDPAEYIELGKWYQVTEGDFKRLYFKIKSWGNGYPDATSPKKFTTGQNVLVRYDSCYSLNTFTDLSTGKGDNLDPNSYEVIYSWNTIYYASQYYAMQYSTGSSYECTSGGLAFPVRFLWDGGEAAVIVPFSLGSSYDQSYYVTTYYGSVTYKRPNYLPE